MSTIASPRDSSVNGGRRIPQMATPTSSSRPSLDVPRSESGSPLPQQQAPPLRRNRTALREYYNLKNGGAASTTSTSRVAEETTPSELSSNDHSDVAESELDSAHFVGDAYVRACLETQPLGELLRTYNGVLADMRALDAEKKALVYDNYSKLIAATETIRRMRDNMDPLNPMANTLDPAIRDIYERAIAIRDRLRAELEGQGHGNGHGRDWKEDESRRKKRELVTRVLDTPQRVRELVESAAREDAEKEWSPVRKLLERWLERGVGGPEVKDCLDDGNAALRGEPPGEKSWVNVKKSREILP
ncbi:hypothetical protein PVAG01_03118 [Phlyctema vagabunda]|uniref:Vacuolar protein sorting-associated protein 51 homolog n=1 Tax=Phlyctema vagabunda TaxID=108571 RepID=A0ABR4PSS8_9HELO